MKPLHRYARAIVPAALLGSLLSPAVADAQWVVQGAQAEWEMTAWYPWVGGNYFQLRERREAAVRGNERLLAEVFTAMMRDARDADALLLNLESFHPPRPSTVRIQVLSGRGLEAAREVGVAGMFDAFTRGVRNDHPSSIILRGAGIEELTTAGYPARRVAYDVREPDGNRWVEVLHVVLLSDYNHVFRGSFDGRVARERVRDLDRMLATLRYTP